mmetsp:Transcript_28686/g.58370  ORF Transcript_28686/g.58370 Transcript_28686/m.58370 type:complete len:203 (-) Transcript_28686:194-802(-)
MCSCARGPRGRWSTSLSTWYPSAPTSRRVRSSGTSPAPEATPGRLNCKCCLYLSRATSALTTPWSLSWTSLSQAAPVPGSGFLVSAASQFQRGRTRDGLVSRETRVLPRLVRASTTRIPTLPTASLAWAPSPPPSPTCPSPLPRSTRRRLASRSHQSWCPTRTTRLWFAPARRFRFGGGCTGQSQPRLAVCKSVSCSTGQVS